MMYAILIILSAIAFAILAWRDLRFSLILMVALLPTYLIRFTIGPLPLTLLEVFLLIALIAWIAHTLHPDEKRLRKAGGVLESPLPLGPMILFLAAASFGVVVADDTTGALGIWKAYFLEPMLIFVILRSVLKKREDWELAFKALCVSALGLSLFAIVQYMTGAGIPTPWDAELRVTSVFDYPNALGLLLGPIVTAAMVLLMRRSKSWLRSNAIYLITILLGILAIVLAETEGAYVAIPAAVVVAFLFSSAKKKTKIRVALEAVAVVVILIIAIPSVSEKLLLQDYSGRVRIAGWQESIEMLVANPAFGAGLNGFPDAVAEYHDPTYFEIFQYPHNIILNIWSELGLLGLFAFAWLAWLVVKQMRGRPADPLVLAAFAALAMMTIHGLVDVPYFKNDLATMTWIFVGMMAVPKKK